MKKTKIFIFGFNNFILEENKNIYGNAFIPSKSHWVNDLHGSIKEQMLNLWISNSICHVSLISAR